MQHAVNAFSSNRVCRCVCVCLRIRVRVCVCDFACGSASVATYTLILCPFYLHVFYLYVFYLYALFTYMLLLVPIQVVLYIHPPHIRLLTVSMIPITFLSPTPTITFVKRHDPHEVPLISP